MAKWWQYFLNPIGTLGAEAVKSIQNKLESNGVKTEYGEGIEEAHPEYLSNNPKSEALSGLGDLAQQLYDDITGVSAVKLQNQLNREMAEEEYQRNIQSIGDTAAAYEAAGYNKNLLYSGASPASYSAPALQQYSGSSKLDTILSRVGKVVGLIPAFYQASAALEGIDQARERTKQSEIKTMSMGMSLLDQGYKLGDQYLSKPFIPKFRNGLNPLYYMFPQERGEYSYSGKILSRGDLGRYANASLQHQFDLLESIGIKNQMNTTLNNWRGYQYDLDRRFGAAGRIVGMASQGIGAAAKAYGSLYSPIKLGGYKR